MNTTGIYNENHIDLRNKKIGKYYSIFVALLPIIAIYSSGIPGLTAGDIILAVFMGASFYFDKRMSVFVLASAVFPLFILCIYIWTLPLLNGLVNDASVSDILIRSFRITFYIMAVLLTSGKLLNIKITEKWITYISVAAVIYILIQYAVYYISGSYLKGYVSFLNVYNPGYDYNYEQVFSLQFFRPTSFFLEPAHAARYLLMGVCFKLFQNNQKSVIWAIVISVGVVLTTSGQGLFILAVLWAYYLFFISNTIKKHTSMWILLALILLLLLILGVVNIPIVEDTLSRTDGAFNARFGTFFEIVENSDIQLFFGHGYGAVPYLNAWMSGLTYVLYGAGIVGILLLFWFFLMSVSKKGVSKLLAIVFLLFFFVDDSFNSYMSVTYISLIIYCEQV